MGCRCADIAAANADWARLDAVERAVRSFRKTLDDTDDAARALKQQVSAAAEVGLGSVPDDRWSAQGRAAADEVDAGVGAARERLGELLDGYRSEDKAYHAWVRQERLRQQREAAERARRQARQAPEGGE